MAIVKRLEGQRFGRLVVVKEVGRTKSGQAKWLCKCDCGNTKVIGSDNLRRGVTKSCGCIRKEMKPWNKRYTDEDKVVYGLWAGIKNRCYNKNEPKYKNYGARGIRVCDEWLDYTNFKNWCLANGYQKGLTIDRIDVNKNYSPDNCKFATQKVQQNNRTNNHLITYKSETHTMSQWAEKLGMRYGMLEHRINRGWSVEDAFNVPYGGRPSR